MSRSDALCIHDIIAEWCWTCKHENPDSIRSMKRVLIEENKKISENILKWPTKS